jgi:hypothetical protein
MGYVLFMFTHRAHACERACAERVVKHSLIYGLTLFQFAVNILQITTSSMGYVLFMSACVRALSNGFIFGRILFKFANLLGTYYRW